MSNDYSNQLKISTKSNPGSIAGAIAGQLKTNPQVELHAVGAGSVNQAIKAIAIARGFLAPIGINLVCIPSFENIEINNEEKTSIKIIVRGEC